MKHWKKVVVGVALVVIPGTLIAGSIYGVYKMIDSARKKKKLADQQKEEQKNG